MRISSSNAGLKARHNPAHRQRLGYGSTHASPCALTGLGDGWGFIHTARCPVLLSDGLSALNAGRRLIWITPCKPQAQPGVTALPLLELRSS
jgi:hypothetical protein